MRSVDVPTCEYGFWEPSTIGCPKCHPGPCQIYPDYEETIRAFREKRWWRIVRLWLVVVAIALVVVVLTACSTTGQPAVKVEYREVLKEVQRPCPATKPTKPKSLVRPLPKDAGRLVDLLVAKLTEWAGPGGYGERADSALDTCTKAP